jgi:myosin heavy chain 6/7
MLEPDAGKYFYINQGKLTIDKLDDAQEMRDTKKAFDILLFTQVIPNITYNIKRTKITNI